MKLPIKDFLKILIRVFLFLKSVHKDWVFHGVYMYHSKYEHHIQSDADIVYNPIMF